MEPRIQYAKTSDGVSIAYWTLGEGPPLVYMPPNLNSHIQLEWQWPAWRAWYQRVAENWKVVRYDGRGSGLSDRDVTQYSFESAVLDLEAVLERLGLERFNLLGNYAGAAAAIAYSARYPDRLSHLVLWSALVRFSDIPPAFAKIADLAAVDWELFTETAAGAVHGWPEGGEARRFAAFVREATSPETFRAFWKATPEFLDSVGADLLRVTCPTLVLHRRQLSMPPIESARYLASSIPDAQLVIVEGESREAFLGDWEAVAAAIDEFLGEGAEPLQAQSASLPEGTAIILFADIADSTALTERLGDAAYRERERALDTTLREAITKAGGMPVEGKVLGDGVMAVFTSARQAIDCALGCRAVGEEARLPLHLGIHAGDVIREGNNVHGGAVNIAARIADASAPGEILVSDTVRSLARTSAGVAFEDRGERALKGIADPQRLFAVRRREA